MVVIEVEFEINKENVGKFDDWLQSKPDCITKIRMLTGEELEKLES